MTESNLGEPTAPLQPPAEPMMPPPPAPMGQHAAPMAPPMYPVQTGKIRGTGMCILLAFVTLGIYPLVWYYMVHDEMKRHTNQGLGGGVALILAFFVGIVMPYLTAGEVGKLYENRGQPKPVSAATGLWYFPGIFILIGPIVWFVKTNGALNNYWRSVGVR